NISYLSDFEPFDEGYVSFGQGGCKITGKGTIKTDLECIVLGRNFKLLDDTNIFLRTPRQHNMYSIDLNNIVPYKDLTCLVAKASADECILWHMRLGHLNVKTMNKLVRHNLVRGLPTKSFDNDHTCTACLEGKLHKASWIKREFSNARTPQQNGVAERRNRTLIEAARTMLADAKLPVTFWAKAVNTACYVQNRVLVNKSHNKTPYELFNSRTLAIGFLKPFGCHVMILNTLDNLAKFEAKGDEGIKDAANQEVKKDVSSLRYILFPNWAHDALLESSSTDPMETLTVESPIPTISHQFEDILGVTTSSDEAIRVEADISNMETTISASLTPTFKIHKDHPKSQIIGPVDTPIRTRHKSKEMEEQSLIATLYQKTNPALLQFCLFSCFLSQVEPKKVSDTLQDPSWVEAMQEELLQFKIQKVWTLVDCPKGVRPIRTKWVLKNKKDERGNVVRNKARLVAQGHTQEEGIDYDEEFASVARIKAIRLFLAYASFMGFTVYQMDPPGFQDPVFPTKVYKVEKAMYGLHQALRAWYGTLFKYLLKNGFQRGTIDQTLFIRRQFEALMHKKFQMSAMGELNFFLGLQVMQKEDGIFLSQDKYIGYILKQFRFSDVRSSNTFMDKENP
nr:retrovirus-related Pol polyprotein from transposon TNT 1-94 [Tanacetum cinerariifolium]